MTLDIGEDVPGIGFIPASVIPTIKRLEAQDGRLGGRSETGAKIRAALEAAGVEFIDENGGGPGGPSPQAVPREMNLNAA